MHTWHLLHCKAQQQERAQWHLANQGLEVFCPYWQVEKRRRGKRQQVTEPLFPSYLFILLDRTADNFNAVRSTRGVNGFVRFGGAPAVVPEQVISSLQERVQTENQQAPKSLYQQGSKVEVLSGPFAGLNAIYDIRDGEERCFVLIDMLGKNQRLSVAETDIKPAAD